MLVLSTDNEGILTYARNMVSAQKKAKAHANTYNEIVYIMFDEGETGYSQLEAIKPTNKGINNEAV